MDLDRLDAATYAQHPLHGPDRTWSETNCYVDIWIEIVGHLGLPPEPAGVCAFSADALPGQWSFLKYQPDDLRALYGIEVGEFNLWKSIEEHLVEHMAAGNLVTLEADSWYLPDTEGVAYGVDHVKSTIVPTRIDPAARTMTYFHNSSLYALEGDDYDGVFDKPGSITCTPQPYVELVRFDRVKGLDGLAARTVALAREHLHRRPADNPVARFADQIREIAPTLKEKGFEYFHKFSFSYTRQLGLTAQNAADACRWLAEHGLDELGPDARDRLLAAADDFDLVSREMKNLQFALARVTGGRTKDLEPVLTTVTEAWGRAIDTVALVLA